MKKLILIDGNAILHRAYHALPPLTNKDGIVVNAVSHLIIENHMLSCRYE